MRELAMFAERLIAGVAIRWIKSAIERGDRVLGVDGFWVGPTGFVAALDLILDLSAKSISLRQAAAGATDFVVSRAADDVVFEVVVELRPAGK